MTKKEIAQELANEVITHPYTNKDIDRILRHVYSLKYKDGSNISDSEIDYIIDEISNRLEQYIKTRENSEERYFSSDNTALLKSLADYLKNENKKIAAKK